MTSAANAQTNEVGDKFFVFEPKATPIYVSKGGTRYWPCEGMIAPKLIEIVHRELKVFSEVLAVPLPLTSPCLFNIYNFEISGNSYPMHNVDFFVSTKSMKDCIENNFCDNSRSMNFKFYNGNYYRLYLVGNAKKKLTRMMCFDMQGNIQNTTTGACSE